MLESINFVSNCRYVGISMFPFKFSLFQFSLFLGASPLEERLKPDLCDLGGALSVKHIETKADHFGVRHTEFGYRHTKKSTEPQAVKKNLVSQNCSDHFAGPRTKTTD